jgi:hypothetical protein
MAFESAIMAKTPRKRGKRVLISSGGFYELSLLVLFYTLSLVASRSGGWNKDGKPGTRSNGYADLLKEYLLEPDKQR